MPKAMKNVVMTVSLLRHDVRKRAPVQDTEQHAPLNYRQASHILRISTSEAPKVSKKGRKTPPNNPHATNPLVQAFATRLRQWRKQRGLTLKYVSAETGFSMPIICEWEHGDRFPAVENLQAIAQYIGISASDLLRPLTAAELKKTRSCVSLPGASAP